MTDGFARQLAARRELFAAGARSVGWKVGFGSPAALERLGIVRPLVGFLTDRALLVSGASVSLAGWTRPVLEPEVAVRVGRGALAPALELADLHFPPDDAEEILAANVYQRHVVVGEARDVRVDELSARVYRNGGLEAETDDVQALTGELAWLVEHVRGTLHAAGEELAPDEIVICGSVVPPLDVAPGDEIRYELDPLGSLELRFSSK